MSWIKRMTRLVTFLFLASCTFVNARTYLNVSGDILLGALFPIHGKGGSGENCGKIKLEDGIQPLEAMLYTLQQINQDPKILPGVRLGALVFDSCDNPSYALEQALNFVKGFIAHSNEFHVQEYECRDKSVPKFSKGGFDKIVAVLADQSSSVTIQVASMLKLFSVPQISYMATSPALSNKKIYPHFFRTIPSDLNQAHAMLEILKQFEWTYVSIVYSDTEYGNHGYETLTSLAYLYSICFSTPQRINKEHFTNEDYDTVIRTIANKTDVRVVVLFAEKSTTLRVLDAAKRLNVGTRFLWIGSDSWSSSNHRDFADLDSSRMGQEMAVLEGALVVQPLSRQLSGFDKYFTNLTLEHEKINPWFREFWQEYHRCGINDTESMNITKEYFYDSCLNESLTLNISMGYKQQKFLHFVRDAIYSMAHALHDMQKEKCGEGYNGICSEMKHIDGIDLTKYLQNVSFKDDAGNKFRFVDVADGPPRYSILNYQRNKDGAYRWIVIGNYTENENGTPSLYIETTAMKYRNQTKGGRKYFPNSTCSRPCESNQVMIREEQDLCCWRCRKCGLYQYKVNDQRCEDCLLGTRPTKDSKRCDSIPEEYIDYYSPWAIVAMVVASIGILLTIYVWFIFRIYGETPVIKASGRELSSLLLLSILASFLMTFAIVAEPITETCAITRFGIGFCYTLCYAALVTKTNRIHRIFNNISHSPRKSRYTSPKSQLLITGILILLEVIVNVILLIRVPPRVKHIYPTRDTKIKICQGLDDRSYIVSLIYPFVLIVICTIYAIKTRKCPEGFNETKHIAFTNYTTMVLWLAFVPLYLVSNSNAIRVVTLALSLSLSGLVQLACLFFPKIYIVLIKPEKNTKELVMAQHRSSSYLPTSATPVVALNGNPFIFHTTKEQKP
ncbi:metabotropic glutamate receptor 2-like isoform X1 [Vespula pensylvanica]|uniref:metabotropic glutamate receptor 2-like isoform X1 n=2 Tax=Vespula pensylvanica TaxID=30213 RepID=UPI001CBA4B04|nr:metabotropic glutamate receptor 2-like isoform X1 [Vespula pensylvanica]